MLFLIIIHTLIYYTSAKPPPESFGFHNAVENFQNAVQQQTFQSVLIAIEERLRNLDHIYSMQLAETLKSKLDQYQRKLDSLDMKIIRLESIVMLNLDKISENISTKTHKDDIAVTQSHKKLDSMYDSLSYRMNYMERKSDMGFDKLQNKIDTISVRLEKMEENMVQRSSDLEEEFSETLFILEDLKISSASSEKKLQNIDISVNKTLQSVPIIKSINISMQNLITELNRTFTTKLENLEDVASRSLNISETNREELNSVKLELKDDFNEYANKVADMNMDLWRRDDTAEEGLKTIESVANSTRIEVQNGIRSLMLQIGKLSGKAIMNNDDFSLETLTKSVNLSLEKIISSQELFLESCHRVQMDESQIESEISVMLGKLIDMLEKKMTTIMKDLKSVEKSIKNHDTRTTRNLYQASKNIVSLFEKTTKIGETNEKQLEDLKFYVNSLFTFVQDVLPKNVGNGYMDQNIDVLLQELLLNISNYIEKGDSKNINELETILIKQYNISKEMYDLLQSHDEEFKNSEHGGIINLTNNIDKLYKDIKSMIVNLKNSYPVNSTESDYAELFLTNKTTTCKQGYADQIDIRADECDEVIETMTTPVKYPEGDNDLKKAILELFGTPPSVTQVSVNDPESSTENIQMSKTPASESQDINEEINREYLDKQIIEIFGKPPVVNLTIPHKNVSKTETIQIKNKDCIPTWKNLINIRADENSDIVECSKTHTEQKINNENEEIYSGHESSTTEFSEDLSTTEIPFNKVT